jgi:hypothetical protein
VLYLEHVRGFGVLQTGLAFLAQTLVLALLSLCLTARLVIRFGPRVPLIVGLLAAACGLLIIGQMSAAIGVAVLGTVATDRTQTLTAHGSGHAAALLGGYHLAFTVATGSVVAAMIAALLLLRDPRQRQHAIEAERADTLVEAEAA